MSHYGMIFLEKNNKYDSMNYSSFEYHVNTIVGDTHCNEHKHSLQSVHYALRERFLHTLNLGYKIPEALYHINLSSRLPEKNYQRYIRFVQSNVSATTFAGA